MLTTAAKRVAVFMTVVALGVGGGATAALAGHHHHHHHSSIPQHNGGDHDSDTRGGPSDGDGNV